jgi:D-alanyl-lipoteichoic acid acyltransferase DltB (MBOAT superfamily)
MLNFDSFAYFADLLAIAVVVVPVFYLLRRPRHRRILLTLVGVYLLFVIAPRLALFYAAFWMGVFVLQRVLARWRDGDASTMVMWVSVVVALTPMVVWKLWPAGFVLEFNLALNGWLRTLAGPVGQMDAIRQIILPLGLSFATFRAVDLLVQTYLGAVDGLPLDRLLFFGFFPPVQMIGPVMEYKEIAARSDTKHRLSSDDVLDGGLQIIVGLIKVFVLAWPLQTSIQVFAAYDANPAYLIWFELFLFAWFFYFNFAGYSDLAIGVSRLFGFELKPNFASPFTKTNPQDFWNSWHMSLTRFAQRNVFVPLGGMRRRSQYLAIVATIMVIALWHDLTLPLIIFGIYHAIGLVAHRYSVGVRPARPESGIAALKPVALFTFVMLSLPLLVIDIGDVGGFYAALVGV